MILTLDFETHPIAPERPFPAPVGCALKVDGRRSRYLAWGHPRGNCCDAGEALRILDDHVRDARRVVMFNAPFDVGVGRPFGLDVPWVKVDDVQVMAFLADPYAQKRDLKSFAATVLGDPPEERDALHAWVKANIPEAKRLTKKLGQFYARAPGDVVGPYACDDVDKTYALYQHWKKTTAGRAYDREAALLPILERMHLAGLPIDHAGLAGGLSVWRGSLAKAGRYLCRRLGVQDLGTPRQIMDAMEKADLITEWIETQEGHRSLAYESLRRLADEGKADAAFVEAYGYFSVLSHCIRTFAEPWLQAGAVFHPQWNGTRQERGGAVTGRLSSTPNVQNIITRPPAFKVPRSWCPVPALRRYVKAPAGFSLVGADISQQELRVLAHFVGDPLRQWYREDPGLDLHRRVSEKIRETTGLDVTRDQAKTINLAKIYKQGIAATASKLGCEYEQAAILNHAHRVAVPGVGKWEGRLKAQVLFETAGGRPYYHDPVRPYKSGNTQIQGSAADQLKDIMIAAQPQLIELGGSLRLTAHDELAAVVPERRALAAAEILEREIVKTGWPHEGAMFDVPMRADGYIRERWEQ